MASEWNYKYTDKAVEDLEQIMFYISEKLSNKKAASDFLNELEATVGILTSFPKSGTLVKNNYLSDANVRFMVLQNYMVYYYPDYEKLAIIILRIIYGRRDPEYVYRQLKSQFSKESQLMDSKEQLATFFHDNFFQ